MPDPNLTMEKLVSLSKRRGFVYQNSEIYGGINGFWDFGPVGVELRRNIRDSWWDNVVTLRDQVVGLDSAIINHPRTWEASGHVESFHDPLVDCKDCKKRFRADHVEGELCPECGGLLTDAREFNLMFKTYVGSTEDSQSIAYLRPETCQAIFTNFKNIYTSSRIKIPFGIAQIGKSFRNEITPRNFIFRSREFEQLEMEFFIHPSEAAKWYQYWRDERMQWFYDIGVKKENLRFRDHPKDELAHYATACVDIEFLFPFGWQELEGIADRGTYDLSRHIEFSGKDLSFFDEVSKEKFVPAVIETSLGLDRTFLVVIADAYCEDIVEGETRVVMKFHPSIAPVKIAVLPLSKKLSEGAEKLEKDLRKSMRTDFDVVGSIGKRYRRQDEIGTPFCVTYDFQSEEDKKVTIRYRDTLKQDRLPVEGVKQFLIEKIGGRVL